MRFLSFTKLSAISILFLLGASACSTLGASSGQVTPTPLPTSGIADMTVVPSPMCLVGEQDVIRTENPQGDLLSWSPVSDTLAYIATTKESTWNVGDLDLISAPGFDSPTRLATQVAGEISWAPDATSIAYLGLRRSDNLYTIGLAYPDGRPWRDFFPGEAARTDDYSSTKSILEWMDSGRLRVMVSCGVNCLQTLDIGVLSGLSTRVGDPLEKYWGMWAVHTFHPAIIPDDFAKLAGQLNWSWDSKYIAYIDEHGDTWVINPGASTLFPLEVGQYGNATETDWSHDNRYLAVQVERNLKIFSFQCP